MQYDAKINAAIRDCLNSFPVGGSHLDHLADYAETLSADSSWSRVEIHEVESSARRIFAQLRRDAE